MKYTKKKRNILAGSAVALGAVVAALAVTLSGGSTSSSHSTHSAPSSTTQAPVNGKQLFEAAGIKNSVPDPADNDTGYGVHVFNTYKVYSDNGASDVMCGMEGSLAQVQQTLSLIESFAPGTPIAYGKNWVCTSANPTSAASDIISNLAAANHGQFTTVAPSSSGDSSYNQSVQQAQEGQ